MKVGDSNFGKLFNFSKEARLGYVHTVTFSHRFLLFGSKLEFPWDCGTIQSHAKTLPCARSLGISQGAERTKVHVYLPYRGAISFYVYIVCTFRPNKYISVCWTRSYLLWALANTFLFKIPYKTIIVKKGEFQIHFYQKPLVSLER